MPYVARLFVSVGFTMCIYIIKLLFSFVQVIENVFSRNECVVASTKNSFADLVTETDHQIEEMIIQYLHNRYPTHR